MSTAIKVENLSKAYQLGEIGTGTLSRDLERYWAKLRGKEDPFLKIGEANDRTQKGTSDIVWSLKDLNFEIEQGDAVGIIGRNGAGKSTLLKILSRVTSPTTGSVKIKGRVASLLEVGTGFHPELSGRENIFLNGAILGMRKAEVRKHFDAIVDFAGVERYIDTPVKRYSSGMYVRLAFAVAAHLESEILVVDEVLAVGDAEFQKKCLGKMNDVSKGEGRTVLFVSHNMSSIENLCNKGLLLNGGQLLNYDLIKSTIRSYREIGLSNKPQNFISNILINKFILIGETSKTINSIKHHEPFKILIKLENTISSFRNTRVIIGIYNFLNDPLIRLDSKDTLNETKNTPIKELNIEINYLDNLNLKPGEYYTNIAIYEDNTLVLHTTNFLNFTIQEIDYTKYNLDYSDLNLVKIIPNPQWKKIEQ